MRLLSLPVKELQHPAGTPPFLRAPLRVACCLIGILHALPAQTLLNTHTLASSGDDIPAAIATDPQGNVYLAGTTNSPDFPTKNALYPPPPRAGLARLFGWPHSHAVHSLGRAGGLRGRCRRRQPSPGGHERYPLSQCGWRRFVDCAPQACGAGPRRRLRSRQFRQCLRCRLGDGESFLVPPSAISLPKGGAEFGA
jgi:hypothetical protein